MADKATAFSVHERVWGRDGWFTKVMVSALDEGDRLPCAGKELVYDGVASPIARRAAAQNCVGCPIADACLRAGLESGYAGVWGGKYLTGGTTGPANVAPLTPRQVTNWMKKILADESILEEEYLREFGRGIPTLLDILASEGGWNLLEMKGACLQLKEPDPRAAVMLRRRITRDAIMLGQDVSGTARIELTCGQFSQCVAPWHMEWYRDRANVGFDLAEAGNRNVALALYAVLVQGWRVMTSAQVSGLHELFVAQLKRAAGAIGNDTPFVSGTASDVVTWYQEVTGRMPGPHETSAVLTLMRAGLEMSCFNVDQLCAVGSEDW